MLVKCEPNRIDISHLPLPTMADRIKHNARVRRLKVGTLKFLIILTMSSLWAWGAWYAV